MTSTLIDMIRNTAPIGIRNNQIVPTIGGPECGYGPGGGELHPP
jgi:hypothetical protein